MTAASTAAAATIHFMPLIRFNMIPKPGRAHHEVNLTAVDHAAAEMTRTGWRRGPDELS